MKRFETIEKIPTWALCYIINGDPTGLSDEDIKMVDGFMQKWQVEIVSPLSQDGNASFSHCLQYEVNDIETSSVSVQGIADYSVVIHLLGIQLMVFQNAKLGCCSHFQQSSYLLMVLYHHLQ